MDRPIKALDKLRLTIINLLRWREIGNTMISNNNEEFKNSLALLGLKLVIILCTLPQLQ